MANRGPSYYGHGWTPAFGAAVHAVAGGVELMGPALAASEPSNDGGVVITVQHVVSIMAESRQVKFNVASVRGP